MNESNKTYAFKTIDVFDAPDQGELILPVGLVSNLDCVQGVRHECGRHACAHACQTIDHFLWQETLPSFWLLYACDWLICSCQSLSAFGRIARAH